MTSKVYRSAQGKMVDLGTIMLQNEHVRAVGNMKVNARGDKLDTNNQVIETKGQQIQRQNDRTSTNVTDSPVHTSSRKNRSAKQNPEPEILSTPQEPEVVADPEPVLEAVPVPVEQVAPVESPTPQPIAQPTPVPTPHKITQTLDSKSAKGGLAGAIARNREIKQELDRTRRQQAQDGGIKKI